jgi:hypothetical protein
MAITFKYGGASFTVNTPQEAAETLALLQKQQAEQKKASREARAQAWLDRKISRSTAFMEHAQVELSAYLEGNKYKWTPDRFESFISRLGEAQKLVLALLTTKGSVTDVDLRAALGVPDNQALAGVLSGISKQAVALFIPPRAIFDFENFRFGGKRRSDYLVVDEFRKIAGEMNWPPSSLLAQPQQHNT